MIIIFNRCSKAADNASLLASVGGVGRDLCLHAVPCEVYQVLMKYMALMATEQEKHKWVYIIFILRMSIYFFSVMQLHMRSFWMSFHSFFSHSWSSHLHIEASFLHWIPILPLRNSVSHVVSSLSNILYHPAPEHL